jgi:hypothetical protein
MTRKSPEPGAVAEGLRRLLRRGLPATAAADPVLLDLRGVAARAAAPDEAASRALALDALLRQILARFDDAKYAGAARALFGLAPAAPGQNLTVRRDLAARQAGHEVNHFRKRIEPRLVDAVAARLLADAEAFASTSLIAPRLAAAAARQRIPADPFAWEVAGQEADLCGLWAAIYALRAELLAIERLISLGAERVETVPRIVTASWRWGQARAAAEAYTAAYEESQDAAALVALAGWAPALTAEQARTVTEAAGAETRTEFLAAVRDDARLSEAWVAPFFDHHSELTD